MGKIFLNTTYEALIDVQNISSRPIVLDVSTDIFCIDCTYSKKPIAPGLQTSIRINILKKELCGEILGNINILSFSEDDTMEARDMQRGAPILSALYKDYSMFTVPIFMYIIDSQRNINNQEITPTTW